MDDPNIGIESPSKKIILNERDAIAPLLRDFEPFYLRRKFMNILITGGAGFIGSAVVQLAISRGHSVVVDALTYAASLEV